ncbi:MAG: GTP cyclohydrolase I FolE2 [Bdellovibrio sp.]|nr:GTP cyclohydrolase I FolE2 [Bdellovibrio sp.]
MNQTSKIQSDVQSETNQTLAALAWVGMGQIQSSLNIGEFNVPCLLDLGVDLKAGHRGIHMSRLYQVHQDYFLHKKLILMQMTEFLAHALKSQGEISSEIAMKVSLQFSMTTKSLKSKLPGFRNYPLQVIIEKNNQTQNTYLQFEVLYSSTCPQSAGLSMEVLKAGNSLPERLPATPHAQRSRTVVKVQVADFSEQEIQNLILSVENAVQTPVQTAVKKADEMEFAVLNAQNLMFCEDAARKIALGLQKNPNILGFSVFCEHQESLHPHNASSVIMLNYRAPMRVAFS